MLILLQTKNADVFNVGNPAPEISMINLAELICEITGISKGVELVPYPSSYPEDEPNRRCPDIQKISNELSFQPQIHLEEGLKRFFDWSKQNYTSDVP